MSGAEIKLKMFCDGGRINPKWNEDLVRPSRAFYLTFDLRRTEGSRGQDQDNQIASIDQLLGLLFGTTTCGLSWR
jgi:hypothetical protein